MEDTFPRYYILPKKSILPQLHIKSFLKFSPQSNETFVKIDILAKIFNDTTIQYFGECIDFQQTIDLTTLWCALLVAS